MLKVGQAEIDGVAKVIESKKMFRYDPNGECGRFEERYGKYIGSKHVVMCSSGTAALAAAMAGMDIGPGCEVIVPAHTYMATAVAALAVGAIPVIIDIDESITMDPHALKLAIGPRTKAVIPVHMWGALCDMDAIMAIAKDHNIQVLEDACQCVGGFYKGKGAGSIGDAGAFSFNYFKNMTCGEGGAVATNNEHIFQRARCMIDPCSFYWEGRDATFTPFVNPGSRASEFEGAMLNAQLDHVPALIEALRKHKQTIIGATNDTGLTLTPRHCPDGECATALMYLLDTAAQAEIFSQETGGGILKNTGRHNYTEWDPILTQQGAHHPAMNPYNFPLNAECRMEYSKEMCPKSLDILGRTVSIGLRPELSDEDIQGIIDKIRAAAEKL